MKKYIDGEFWINVQNTNQMYDADQIDFETSQNQLFGYLDIAERGAKSQADWDKIIDFRKRAGINKYVCQECGEVVDPGYFDITRICPKCGADNSMEE